MAFEFSGPNASAKRQHLHWSAGTWGCIILGLSVVAPSAALIVGTAANLHRTQMTITVASVRAVSSDDSIMPDERKLPGRYLVKTPDSQEFLLENAVVWGVADRVDSDGIAETLSLGRSYRIRTFGWPPHQAIYEVKPATEGHS